MALLLGVIALRNVGWFALITFVPLYEVAIGHSESYGNRLLALMFLAGGIGTFGVTMVMSQEYLPRHIGMASGLTVGFAIGIGGVGAVAVGALADRIELDSALYLAAVMPVLGLALGFLLPPSRERRPLEPELVTP